MNEHISFNHAHPEGDVPGLERAPPRSLRRRLGAAGINRMTVQLPFIRLSGKKSETLATPKRVETRVNEIIVTQGAKVRSIEEFRGVAKEAKIKRAALERVRENRRRQL